RALEDMAGPQLQLLERANHVAQGQGARRIPVLLTSSSPHDPLVQSLQAIVQTLAAGLGDADVRARRTIIDVLESLGAAGAPAGASLVPSLRDPDRFVRWAAARTLGKIAPVAAETAVPGLAELLMDQDLDLRLTAALALERYGPTSKAAVPSLIE